MQYACFLPLISVCVKYEHVQAGKPLKRWRLPWNRRMMRPACPFNVLSWNSVGVGFTASFVWVLLALSFLCTVSLCLLSLLHRCWPSSFWSLSVPTSFCNASPVSSLAVLSLSWTLAVAPSLIWCFPLHLFCSLLSPFLIKRSLWVNALLTSLQ